MKEWAWIVTAFIIGFFTSLSLLLVSLLLYFRPVKRVAKNVKSHLERLDGQDPHLTMSGWIRVSYDELPLGAALSRFKYPTGDTPPPKGWTSTLATAYNNTLSYSAFFISRFQGEPSSAPILVEEEEPVADYLDCYGVLQHKTLFLYTDQEKSVCIRVFIVSYYDVVLKPIDMSDVNMYLTYNPILLKLRSHSKHSPRNIHIYPITQTEKESWFLILRRASRLPNFADADAMSAFYKDEEPARKFHAAMTKLKENTEKDTLGTAWLNAILGRCWIISRILKHTVEREDSNSILGDIMVKDVDFGDSLPMVTNPHLVNISPDGDMDIEIDISYTGGIRVEAATEATIENAYMKPVTVPIEVAVGIKTFSARVLFKVKPFWETNRVWFGFKREPPLKLELAIEPIISNQLIQIQMVNEIIENRIKYAIESQLTLPNMDDIWFWEFSSLSGSAFKPFQFSSDSKRNSVGSLGSIDGMEKPKEVPESIMDASLHNYPIESSIQQNMDKELGLNITNFLNDVDQQMREFQSPSSSSKEQELIKKPSMTTMQDNTSQNSEGSPYIGIMGDAAASLGEFSRKAGLPQKVRSIAQIVNHYTEPTYTSAIQKVKETGVVVGLTAIERLGLKPDEQDLEGTCLETGGELARISALKNGEKTSNRVVKKKSSTMWNLLGLSISTSAPNTSRTSIVDSNSLNTASFSESSIGEAGSTIKSNEEDGIPDESEVRYRTLYKRDKLQ